MAAHHRVCIFSGHYYPHMGGVEKYTAELFGRLSRRGDRVLVVTGNTNNAAEREVLAGIEVLRLPVFNIINDRLPIIKPSRSFFRCMHALKNWSPTLVVTNTRYFPTSALGAWYARTNRLPHFHIEAGSEHIKLNRRMLTRIGEVWDHTIGAWVLRNATKCFGHSKSVRGIVAHLGQQQCDAMYNAVNTALFCPGPSSLREGLAISDDCFLFLYASRLIEEKGIAVALKGFGAFLLN